LTGERIPAVFDNDKQRRELTCQEGFEQCKAALCRLALNRQPDFDKEIIIAVDSSQYGMGAVASQEVNGKLCPLEFYSATHTKEAKRYSSSEREALAIVKAVEHFSELVNGSRFRVRCISDHAGLTSLLKAKKTMNSVRLAGWAAKLQNVTTADGDFTIEYANGSSAIIACGADALSRLLDVGMEPEGDEWHTATSFRDYPVLQAIYAQLDKQMDGRGRPLGGLHTTAATETGTTHDILDLDGVYEPDHLYAEDGKQFFDFHTVHPALHKASNRLAAIDSAISAGLTPPPLGESPILPVYSQTKLVCRDQNGKVLLAHYGNGLHGLPTWNHTPRDPDDSFPRPVEALVQSLTDDGTAFRLPAAASTIYYGCNVTQPATTPPDLSGLTVSWYDIDSLPTATRLDDLMYLRSKDYPDFSADTVLMHQSPDPVLRAWTHRRKLFPVLGAMRPNKQAKGTHSGLTFMGAENDTLSLISRVLSVRAVMNKHLNQPLTTDKQYAQKLVDWNSSLVHSTKATSFPYNRTLPKGGTVVYLTPTGEATARNSSTNTTTTVLNRHNLVLDTASTVDVHPKDYIDTVYWSKYVSATRWGNINPDMAELLCKVDNKRTKRVSPADQLRVPLRGDELAASLTQTDRSTTHGAYFLLDSLLYYRRRGQTKLRLVIPTPKQQLHLIQSVHDDHESHPGPQTTARILSEHYHWRGMHGQIKQYVSGCLHCQKQKQRDIAAYGQLTDPVEPTECGSAWGIDYVCSLGCEGYLNYDTLFVCTDRYSKMTYAFPCHAAITAVQAAHLFHRKIVLELGYGIPQSIYSDRDPTWIAAFQKQFWALHGTRLTTTTAYHSLANHVEARNKYLEQKIRGAGLYTDGWLRRLPQALFSINSMPTRRTGLSPLQIYTGRTPMRPLDTTLLAKRMRSTNTTVQEYLDSILSIQYESEEITARARDMERKIYNQHRTKPDWFDNIGPGCKVLVESKHMSMPAKAYTKPKWTSKYYGPFTVKAIVDRTVVELELPPTSKIHPRFDISRIKPFYEPTMQWSSPDGDPEKVWTPDSTSPSWKQQTETILPASPDDIEHEVKSIISHREDRDGIRYLVHWKGYSPEDSTWERAENCKNATAAVQDYHDRVTRMTTYHAHGDTGQVDYSQLAAIVSARFDDYAYQILKNNDYALHCGMQAPRSVLLSAGGSWDHIPSDPHTSHSDSQQGW
jgi:hypothetical protein